MQYLKTLINLISLATFGAGMLMICSFLLLNILGMSKIPSDVLMFVFQVVCIPMSGIGLIGLILTGQAREDFNRLLANSKAA